MASTTPFRATVAEIGERLALVSVSGELDLHVEGDLRAAFEAAASLGSSAVVVDLSRVEFMDSTVCGLLVREAKRLRRQGSQLVVVSDDNRASRVLELAGIDRVIAVYPTLHAAFRELLPEVAT